MDELDYNYLAELVLKTQRGDSEAFAELYTATYQKQYRFAYRYAKDAYLAQDILQDVYILVLKNINALKNPRKSSSWIISTRRCSWLLFSNYSRNMRRHLSCVISTI